MQEAIQPTTLSEAADALAAAAYRAETWAGEPFLYAGKARPSPQWKVHYGLMLGLERVLADPEPHTAAGTPLRRHQIDALAGMLTELISAAQRGDETNGNGHAAGDELADHEADEEEEDEPLAEGDDDTEDEGLTPEQDTG